MVWFLLVMRANDGAFYTKTALFSGVSHTGGKRFRIKKMRKPSPNMVNGVLAQTLFSERLV